MTSDNAHNMMSPASQDPMRIDVDADDALQTWADKFDVTVDQIREAVAAVGDHSDDVEMHLKGTRSTSNADAEKRAEQSMPDSARSGRS